MNREPLQWEQDKAHIESGIRRALTASKVLVQFGDEARIVSAVMAAILNDMADTKIVARFANGLIDWAESMERTFSADVAKQREIETERAS